MTLNITVLSPAGIYQSADFRLAELDTDVPVQDATSKQVTINYASWRGFVTYAGIGKVGREETAVTVLRWLEGSPKLDFDAVAELIRSRATGWLKRVAPGRRHTFVLAGFVGKTAVAAVISNWEDGSGKSSAPSVDFRISKVVSRSHPVVLVTGQSQFVSREERRLLKHLASVHSREPARLRGAIAQANVKASLLASGLISEACLVNSQHPNGRSTEQVFGEARVEARAAIEGTELMPLIKPLLDEQFGPGAWGMVGSTSFSSGHPDHETECSPIVESKGSGGYELVQLEMPVGRRGACFGLNDEGYVVGEGAVAWRGSGQPCLWAPDGSLGWLENLNGFGGAAQRINNRGTVVGWVAQPDTFLRASVWARGASIDVSDSEPLHDNEWAAISEDGNIAGVTKLRPQDHGEIRTWPMTASPMGSRTILDLPGSAVVRGINDEGRTWGLVHTGRETRAWSNSPGDSSIVVPNPGDCQNLYALAWDDDVIVGLTISTSHRRGGIVRDRSGAWRDLGLAQGLELAASGRDGLIAGYARGARFTEPWVSRIDRGDVIPLPRLRYHNHGVGAINRLGWLIGSANTENCGHPLLWRPA